MTRAPRRIELHLDVEPIRGDDTSDAGGCQLDRGLFRPILDDTGYSLAVAHRPAPDTLVLELRPSLPCAFDARDLAAHLVELAGSSVACRLLGLGPNSVRQRSLGEIELRLDGGAALLEAALSSSRLAPRRDRHGQLAATGAFFARSPLQLESPDGTELRFFVQPSTQAAIDRFERGELALTCPTAFDLRQLMPASSSSQLRRCPTSVHAMVLLNPETTGALAERAGRLSLWQQVTRAAPPDDGVRWMAPDPQPSPRPSPWQPPRPTPSQPPTGGGPLTVTCGGYWPNPLLAASLAEALISHGHVASHGHGAGHVAVRELELSRLSSALQELDFEVLLWLVIGMIPGEDGVLLWMAEMAMNLADEPAQAQIERLFRAYRGDGAEPSRHRLREALLELLPFFPLCGFQSAYLARPWVPDLPLVDGSVYPIEIFASAGR